MVEKLRSLLKGELPGNDIHMKMAGTFRPKMSMIPPKGEDVKRAAVLILLYPKNEKLHTVFMKRNVYDGPHSGQISFPGGQADDSDKDIIDTALREAYEEVGVPKDSMEVIGQLTSLYIPVSKFDVQPVVAYSQNEPSFKPDPSEVQEIIEIDLNTLFHSENKTEREIVIGQNGSSQTLRVPGFKLKNEFIWGATAMILSELEELLEESKA